MRHYLLIIISIFCLTVNAQERANTPRRQRMTPKEFQIKQKEYIAQHAGLTEEESAVFHRGRNHGHGAHPKGATVGEYRNATGMEALFGYLFMMKNEPRITELFALAYPKEAENENSRHRPGHCDSRLRDNRIQECKIPYSCLR